MEESEVKQNDLFELMDEKDRVFFKKGCKLFISIVLIYAVIRLGIMFI